MTPGRFIVVEGLEGAGKSTAMATVQQFLKERSIDFLITREPGGTAVGEAIRSLLKHPSDEVLEARTELLLLYASRLQLVESVIRPALRRGQWVVADRFELSTFAYQGGGRGLDITFIEQLSAFCLDGFAPDLLLFLDVEPQVGLERAMQRGEPDRIEREPLVFFEAVNAAYHTKLKTMQQAVVIDAKQSLVQVQAQIVDALRNVVR